MSILKRLDRLNPRRLAHAVDAIPRLQDLGGKLKEDQRAVTRQLKAMTRQLQQLEQTLQRQQEALAAIPEMQRSLRECLAAPVELSELRDQVRQCMTVYIEDARTAERLPAIRGMLSADRLIGHALAAVERAQVQHDPFPHLHVEHLLPEDGYQELVNAIPPALFFKSKNQNTQRQELHVPLKFAPEYSRVAWGAFFDGVIRRAVLPGAVEKLRPALDGVVAKYWPSLGSMTDAGIALGVMNSRILLRRAGYEIMPHRDPRWAFLTCLVYLQKPGESRTYGTQLYRLREERDVPHSSPFWAEYAECELVKDVPARPNTALIFVNSTGAHGAAIPPDAPADTERYLYQVQYGPDEATKQKLIDALADDSRPAWANRNDRY